jgi:hypothetical protein
MLTSGRFTVFRVEANGGLALDLQSGELSDASSPGKHQILTTGTEREPRPCNWTRGAPLPAA